MSSRYQNEYMHMGVSKNKGTPKWMVKIMENPYIWKHPYMFPGTPPVNAHVFFSWLTCHQTKLQDWTNQVEGPRSGEKSVQMGKVSVKFGRMMQQKHQTYVLRVLYGFFILRCRVLEYVSKVDWQHLLPPLVKGWHESVVPPSLSVATYTSTEVKTDL